MLTYCKRNIVIVMKPFKQKQNKKRFIVPYPWFPHPPQREYLVNCFPAIMVTIQSNRLKLSHHMTYMFFL